VIESETALEEHDNKQCVGPVHRGISATIGQDGAGIYLIQPSPVGWFWNQTNVQGVPPGHKHLNIGTIKLHSSMTFI
jgi:hypothetical protein